MKVTSTSTWWTQCKATQCINVLCEVIHRIIGRVQVGHMPAPFRHFFKYIFLLKLTEQSAFEDCTQPESSFRMQHAVSRSRLAEAAIARAILTSRLMHGANLAPKWIRSAALGPSQNDAGSSHSTFKIKKARVSVSGCRGKTSCSILREYSGEGVLR